MITSILRRADGSLARDLTRDKIAAALADAGALLWLDIESGDRDEVEALLRDVFRFHQLTIDDCYNTLVDPPKVDHYPDYLFVILHDLARDGVSGAFLTQELDMYVGRNFVVSFHKRPVHAVDEVRRLAGERALVLEHGAGFLAHALMDVVVDDFHPVVETLDELVSELESEVLEAPERDCVRRLLELRRTAQQLKRSVQAQRDVAARFARGEYAPLIPPETGLYFRDIHDHTMRVDNMVDTVRDIADGAINAYFSEVNTRTNEVVRTLTVAAVIFLPLTLIASVYGTNFEDTFPQYDAAWGFYAMIGAFIAIIAALGVYFRMRRWW